MNDQSDDIVEKAHDDESVQDEPDHEVGVELSEDDATLEAMRTAYTAVVSEASYQRVLTKVASSFLSDRMQFSPGDVVQWKDGLKDREFPFYKRPMVYLGERQPGGQKEFFAPFGTELWDCWCGYISGDRDFQIFSTDSRRLRLWPKDELIGV